MASVQKREIIFSNSMTANKRHPDFAYVRKNVFDEDSPGMYPSRDFVTLVTPASDTLRILYSDTDVVDVNGNTRRGLTFIQDISDFSLTVIETNTGTVVETRAAANRFISAVRDNEGYLNALISVGDNPPNYSNGGDTHLFAYFVTNTANFIDDRGVLTGGASGESLQFVEFDGVNLWWGETNSNPEIWQSFPRDEAFAQVFNNAGLYFTGFHTYNEDMAIFAENSDASDTYCFIWDKTNNSVFDRRIIKKQSRFIAGGVLDGILTLVTVEGSVGNQKEREARLVVSHYDGENFKEANSIKLGNVQTRRTHLRNNYDSSSSMIVFGLQNNSLDKDELYENWFVRVKSGGAIDVLWSDPQYVARYPKINFEDISFIRGLPFNSGFTTFDETVVSNRDEATDYGTYNNFTQTKYITNFLNNAFNKHVLKGVQVVFEKLHDDEELIISYRTSDRDDFKLLDTINEVALKESDPRYDPALKDSERADITEGIHQQIYSIVKMPDDTNNFEYNEIQFKFESTNGFSIIQAWYSYEYVERNTQE